MVFEILIILDPLVNWSSKILSHLAPSPLAARGRMSTYSIVWTLVIWLTYPILSIRLQGVRQLTQLFEYPSSDHPIIDELSSLSSLESTWTRLIVWILVLVIWLSYPILFIRLQDVRELTQLFEYPTSDHLIPSSSSVSRMYVNLLNCLNTPHLIIPSHLSIRFQIVRESGQLFK